MNRRTSAVRIVALGMTVLAVAYAVGCGNGRPPTSGDGNSPGLAPLASGPCSLEGQSRPCRRLISEHEGIVTCSYGTQECSGGTWTTCGGPSQSIASFPMGAKTMALSPQLLPPLKVVRLPSGASPAATTSRVASSPQSGVASKVTQ